MNHTALHPLVNTLLTSTPEQWVARRNEVLRVSATRASLENASQNDPDVLRRTLATAVLQRMTDPSAFAALDQAAPTPRMTRMHNPEPFVTEFWQTQYANRGAAAFERLWLLSTGHNAASADNYEVRGLVGAVSNDPVDRPERLLLLVRWFRSAELPAAEHARERVVSLLWERARNEQTEVMGRISALIALASTHTNDATVKTGILRIALDRNTYEDVRINAMNTAVALGVQDPAPLFSLLAEPDHHDGCCTLREYTTQALRRTLGEAAMLTQLQQRARSTNEEDRIAAAYAYRWLPFAAAQQGLETLMRDQSVSVRRQASDGAQWQVLTNQTAGRATPASFLRSLEAATRDADERVRSNAREALRRAQP